MPLLRAKKGHEFATFDSPVPDAQRQVFDQRSRFLCGDGGCIGEGRWLVFLHQDVGELYISMLAKFMALKSEDELLPSTNSSLLAKITFTGQQRSNSICLTYHIIFGSP